MEPDDETLESSEKELMALSLDKMNKVIILTTMKILQTTPVLYSFSNTKVPQKLFNYHVKTSLI